ncbi:MAG: zf-HC2 domain-containing protein [Ruminococcus sp.]|nr:zf-HC2 domain-containing protein [Ruminococcus sp.]
MKYDCDLICDLIPLYIDDACSKASADAVREHLGECSSCAELYEDMKKSETAIDKAMISERDEVLTRQARTFKRRSVLAGGIIGGIFALPILICLIVNLASGAGLSWFFIVLTAMFIPASLTVVPLMMPDNKALWTLGGFTVSLITLLGVCCLYSGGSWFFTAASAVLFGLSVPFLPAVVRAKPIAARLGKHKGTAVMAGYTVTFVLMMICIGIGSRSPGSFFGYAAAFSLPMLAYMWGIFALIRFLRWNAAFKAAACIFLSALMFFLYDTLVLLLLGRGLRFPTLDFTQTGDQGIIDSISWAVLFAGAFFAAIIAAVGAVRNKKK